MTAPSDRDLATALAKAKESLAYLEAVDWSCLHSLAYTRHVGETNGRSSVRPDAWVGNDEAKRLLADTWDWLKHVETASRTLEERALDLTQKGYRDDTLRGTLLGRDDDLMGKSAKAEHGRQLKTQTKRRPPWQTRERQPRL